MIEITHGRANPMIDPHLEIWEWQIPGYLFLGGLVAGLMILNGIWRLSRGTEQGRACIRTGALWAPILMSLGMLLLFLDLSYKVHVFRFYTTFQIRSPMSWGAWILILVYPLQILALALPGGLERFGGILSFLNPIWNLIKSIAGRIPRAVAVGNIVLGGMLGIYTGVLLSTFAARPLWNTTLLAPLFLVSGMSAASAWNLLSRPTSSEQHSLLLWDAALLVTEFFFIILIVIGLLTGTEGQIESAKLLLGGQFTASFWVLVVFIGILLPLWLELRESMKKFAPAWLGPVLVLIGGLALRFVIVGAGQVSHLPDMELMGMMTP